MSLEMIQRFGKSYYQIEEDLLTEKDLKNKKKKHTKVITKKELKETKDHDDIGVPHATQDEDDIDPPERRQISETMLMLKFVIFYTLVSYESTNPQTLESPLLEC
jgi:hypothetical protein